MPRILTQQAAITRLKFLASTDTYPKLDEEQELPVILAQAVNAVLWVTATAYAIGDKVQPTAPNGHVYIVTTAGTSGATEPDWSTGREASVSDGDTLVFQEAGDEYYDLWDMNYAVSLAWQAKAQKALTAVDFTRGGYSTSISAVYDRCIEQSNIYAGRRVMA